MVIHFFTNRYQPRIDFRQLLDNFFPSIENAKITSSDESVTITITEPSIEFSYSFKITKRNTLRSIYTLNKDYIYTNMFVEIPTLIPSYIDKMILKVVDQLCKTFKLSIYHERVKDITEFNLLDMLGILYEEKHHYIVNNDVKGFYMNPDQVFHAFSYLQHLNHISKLLPKETLSPKYDVMYDRNEERAYLAFTWVNLTSTIIPPDIDYVIIEEEENLVSIIPINTFMKYAKRFIKEVSSKGLDINLESDIYYLSEHQAKKLARFIKKMRKDVVNMGRFIPIKITEVIEKE